MTVLVKPQVKDPWRRNRKIRDAIGHALHYAMAADPAVHLFGEGCEVKVHYDHPDIERDFLDHCHTMPIAEDGSVNFCVGAALMGIKPVVDIISSDFLYRAMDSIVNTAAKANFARPDQPITLVIRAEFLTGGPTSGQRNEALFTHIPGLNVVVPSTPRDAYGLVLTALQTPGVTLFFEDREIEDDGYFMSEDLEVGATVPLGKGLVRDMGPRGGVAVLTYGVMRQRVEEAVREAQYQFYTSAHDRFDPDSVDCSVIDLRTLFPLDWDLIRKAVDRTGALLIVEPDVEYGGIGAEIAAWAGMNRIPVRMLGAAREVIPANGFNKALWMPSKEEIIEAIRDIRNQRYT